MKGIRLIQNTLMMGAALAVSVLSVSYISYRQIFRMSGLMK